MDPLSIALIVLTGIVAGFYGIMVGGSSLLTLPALIILGLPPKIAIGTNRFSMLGKSLSGFYKFNKMKKTKLKTGIILACSSLIGSIIGSNVVLQINDELLTIIVGVFTLIFLVITTFKVDFGVKKKEVELTTQKWILTAIIFFVFGIYRGLKGGGTATLETLILVSFFGLTFIESAATRTIIGIASSGAAFLVFLMNGLVDFTVGLVLFSSLGLGAYLGAHYSDKIGNMWIKRIFFVVVFVMSVKLIFF